MTAIFCTGWEQGRLQAGHKQARIRTLLGVGCQGGVYPNTAVRVSIRRAGGKKGWEQKVAKAGRLEGRKVTVKEFRWSAGWWATPESELHTVGAA